MLENSPEDAKVRVEPVALMPTSAGCAVFLGDGEKVIVFYIEPAIGASINAVMAGVKPPRPLTHDLFSQVIDAFGGHVDHADIIKVEGEVFFARLLISAENEIMERKIVEIDARPSDCLALAVRQEAPIYVLREVWDELRDMSDVLSELKEKGE
ncbi:bifunctional nuclease family protein [Verrucomicrobiaceae bacterium 5K15]|uniref:Bifunctional nuclease family protein n=1 Tax=Oceaniferula flava TaxID=2800421 RepID=A0AAE2V912_9BACT|nr:bifunctional nuclease family protein [Oceaniferula flavus]MBK1856317.1 bifunctional nuclease family protein [Oceaniferula flavus]MBM1137624.1 bifunctional nuclease family protein [Oceaniferula flavus]